MIDSTYTEETWKMGKWTGIRKNGKKTGREALSSDGKLILVQRTRLMNQVHDQLPSLQDTS